MQGFNPSLDIKKLPGVNSYVDNCHNEKAASNYRNKETGGLLYFRPVALPKLIKAIFETKIRLRIELDEAIENFSKIEFRISEMPWINLLWDAKTQTMVMKYKTYISHMLIYLYKKDLLTPKEIGTLMKNYAEANEFDIDDAKRQLLNIHSIL